MIGIFFKRHRIFLAAALTLLAVAAYEAYWLYGLYHTQRQALVARISSLLTEAEGAEFAEKWRKSLESDTTVLYTPSPNPQGMVISIGMDTLKGKPKEITVHRIDRHTPEGEAFIAGNFDIRQVDELFTRSLDSIGLPLPHQLRFLRDGVPIDSVATEGYRPADGDPVIPVTTNLNTGIYELRRHPADSRCRLCLHRQGLAATAGPGADEERPGRQHHPRTEDAYRRGLCRQRHPAGV